MFSLLKHKDSFERLLDETESWLYSEQAENQEKNVYIDRLQHLKVNISRSILIREIFFTKISFPLCFFLIYHNKN